MRIEIRNIIRRCAWLHKVARIISYNRGWLQYKKLCKKNDYNTLFNELRFSKKGKRCFLIGNGPSLSIDDLEKLREEDCFGVNEIHHVFSHTVWRPKYYILVDRYSMTEPEAIDSLDVERAFVSDYYWRHRWKKACKAIIYRTKIITNFEKVKFSNDIAQGLYTATTVSYISMQLAVFMGYSEIYLLGFDHSYALEYGKKGRVVPSSTKASHFFRDENPAEIIADVYGMTKLYEAMKGYCDKNGIRIHNLTRGGKLELFDRADFDFVVGQK